MSFVGKKTLGSSIKLSEKQDEGLKNTINEKIFEIMVKNDVIKEKVNYFQ
jgi:hypothetical protein